MATLLCHSLVRHTIMQPFLFIIPFVFWLVYTCLILYYRKSWRSILPYTIPQHFVTDTKVTIIIPARNEAKNIENCLNSLINQQYPANLLQIIVVDDHSTDNTAALVMRYAHHNVMLLSLKDFVQENIPAYKKKAIEVAIEHSSGELIFTTDADCTALPLWIQTSVSFYKQYNSQFIAMPVVFKMSGKPLHIFQSLDFLTLQGITGASVHKGVHSMCNGANLAYSKAAFYAVNGFKGIDTIASGDDMLLMHKMAQQFPEGLHFLLSKDVVVETAPMDTLKDFFNQRIRWASKADQYQDKKIFSVLLLVYFFNFMLLLLPFICLYTNPVFSVQLYPFSLTFNLFEGWLFLLMMKTIVELFFLYPVAKFFGQAKLLWWFPLAQPLHIVYTVIAGWLGKFGSYTWKERIVK